MATKNILIHIDEIDYFRLTLVLSYVHYYYSQTYETSLDNVILHIL